jgi:hypothetical protein
MARRRGAKRAIVAVGRSILIIIWHLLRNSTARFHDLGPGFSARLGAGSAALRRVLPPAYSPSISD